MKIFGNFSSQEYEDITKFLNNNSFVKVESIVYNSNMCEFILFYSYEDENSKENDSENNLNDKK